MTSLTLTTAPQQIASSTNGAIIIGTSSFTFGFGVTAPAAGTSFRPESLNEPLNYVGGYGPIWVWRDSTDDASSVQYKAFT